MLDKKLKVFLNLRYLHKIVIGIEYQYLQTIIEWIIRLESCKIIYFKYSQKRCLFFKMIAQNYSQIFRASGRNEYEICGSSNPTYHKEGILNTAADNFVSQD